MSIRDTFFDKKAVGSLWDVSVALKRGNALPIDDDSVFESEAKLIEYIGDKVTTVAYPGQVVAIVNDTSTQVLYLDQELNYHILGDASAIEELTSNLDALIGDVGEIEESLTGLLEDVGVPAGEGTEATGLYRDIEDITGEVGSISTAVDNIAKDYLTSDDKEELQGNIDDLETNLGNQIDTAKQEAIDAAVKAVLFDGDESDAIANAYDTIKEIAEWIAADETGAAATLTAITTKLDTIEKDYLTSGDKIALQGNIDELTGLVGSLPDTTTSKTVIEYAQELIANLKIGDYAKVSALTELANELENYKTSNGGNLTGIESRLDELETWKDDQLPITSVDTDALVVSNAGELSIRDGYALLSPEDQEKLSKLILNDDGSVATGEKVAAGDVIGLGDWLKTWIPSQANSVGGLVSDELLVQIDEAVRGISINGTVVKMDENNIVDLPIATAEGLGLVKSSTAENKVSVDTTGEMEVNSLNVNKLVQNEDEYLVLDGGSASSLMKN